jgi:hypothetical protein
MSHTGDVVFIVDTKRKYLSKDGTEGKGKFDKEYKKRERSSIRRYAPKKP